MNWIIENFDSVLTILAILVAPIAALTIQKKVESYKERKSRKLDIFKTLLATRANTVSLDHVKALNMIDIEFLKEKTICDTWNIYRDHLNSYPQNQDTCAHNMWGEKRLEYFTDLLYSMSEFFGYSFDKVILKKGAYSPIAHGIIDLEQQLIRKGFVEILAGNKPIKVNVISPENDFKDREE